MNLKQKTALFLLVLFSIPFCSALTSGEGTIIFGTIFSLSVIVIFFLVLSIIINNSAMKVFFMGLSLLTIITSIGIGVSIIQEFFSDLTTIATAYGSFYILLIILTGIGMIALIIWLVIIAFKSFYSYRGLIDDED